MEDDDPDTRKMWIGHLANRIDTPTLGQFIKDTCPEAVATEITLHRASKGSGKCSSAHVTFEQLAWISKIDRVSFTSLLC